MIRDFLHKIEISARVWIDTVIGLSMKAITEAKASKTPKTASDEDILKVQQTFSFFSLEVQNMYIHRAA